MEAFSATNPDSRYPVTLLGLYGPETEPPGPGAVQFLLIGNSVTGEQNVYSDRYARGISLFNSHWGTLRDNVVYNVAGTGIGCLGGNEYRNVFERNFVGYVRGTGIRLADWKGSYGLGVPGQDGTGFWQLNPFNALVDNVATNCFDGVEVPAGGFEGGSGDAYGFGISGSSTGTTAGSAIVVPEYPGEVPGLTRYPYKEPIQQFHDNECYGYTKGGSTVWDTGILNDEQVGSGGTIGPFFFWNVTRYGCFIYPTGTTTFDRFQGRNQHGQFGEAGISQGLYFGDYLNVDVTVRDCDFRGFLEGIYAPTRASGTTTLENCRFECGDPFFGGGGIICDTPWTVFATSDEAQPPRDLVIRNCTYGPGSDGDTRSVQMRYNSNPVRNNHWVVLYRVFVYNHQGEEGNDFRVYYYQQQADFITPHTQLGSIGAEESGRTNRENQLAGDRYVHSEIAPDDATTRPGIDGLVRSLPIP